jgi:hypothetical protein
MSRLSFIIILVPTLTAKSCGSGKSPGAKFYVHTDFGYTFQFNPPKMGLMDYKASLYDPAIERGFKPILLKDGIAGLGHPEVILDWCKTATSKRIISGIAV